MKNRIDMPIFHTAICAGASQIAMMAEQKSPARISVRPVAKTLRNGGLHEQKAIQINELAGN